MAEQMREAMKKAKEHYIRKLIDLGVYKHSDPQLYELTLTELISLNKKYNNQS